MRVTDPILPLLAGIACLLLALAAAEAWGGARIRHGIGLGAACLSGWGALLALIALVMGNAPVRLDLPIGPPGASLGLALDPLAAFALVLVFLAGAAVIAFAAEQPPPSRGAPPPALSAPIAILGACVLALLAADPVVLVLALSTAGLSLWLAGTGTVRRSVGCALPPAAGLAAAAAMLVLAPATPGFGPIGTDAARTALVMLLAFAGPGTLLGLPPFGRSALLATADPTGRAILAGCLLPVAGVLLLRLTLAPLPAEASFWWGLPLLALGSLTALAGAWRATAGSDLQAILIGLSQRQGGLLAIGIGLALIARSADLPGMAEHALGAVCLLLAGQALGGSLVFLAASAAASAAGTARLDRLGGLLHRMPITGAAMLVGLLALLMLPPGIGFAAMWDLAQAILAAPRTGLASAWVLAPLAAVLALSAALALAAAIRMLGVAFLGRPRLPRSSAAEDVPPQARLILLALSGLALIVGLLPALVPALLARLAIRALNEGAERADPSLLALTAGRDAYAPILLFTVVAIAAFVAWRLVRRPVVDERATPAWSGGFAPPPAWLPYGDPLTQADGAGFVPAVTVRVPPAPMPRVRLSAIRLGRFAPWLILAALAPLLVAALAR